MRIAVQGWVGIVGFAVIAGGMVVAATSARAEDGTLYRWETADGTISFTDDAKRVPERYQGTATTVDRGALTDYGHYTETDRSANDDSARRLAERLDALRAANGVSAAGLAPQASGAERGLAPTIGARLPRDVQRRVFTRSDGSQYTRYYEQPATVSPSLPVDPDDPHPVVTERQRVSAPGRVVTETVTVVRQGDRVLSVERPESAEHLSTWDDLTDLTK